MGGVFARHSLCSPTGAPSAPTCRLCERQTKSGGLNGRPEKLQDVCYSWWCLSALSILGRLHWIDQQSLTDFILDCQVSHWGGKEADAAFGGGWYLLLMLLQA